MRINTYKLKEWFGIIVFILLQAVASAENLSINLQSSNGKFVVAENGGGGTVNANRYEPEQWETFILVDLNGASLRNHDPVAIKTINANFFSAIDGGGDQLLADRTALNNWETFIIIKIGGGRDEGTVKLNNDDLVVFKTEKGNFLVVEEGEVAVVSARSNSQGMRETFKLKIKGLPPPGKLSAPFNAPNMIIPRPIGVDESGNTSGDIFFCDNSYLGRNIPDCYRGHEGTDFGLTGGFATMNFGSIDVIAAAGGRVTAIDEGNPDRCYFRFPPPLPSSPAQDFIICPDDPNNERKANRVIILQDDGLTAHYVHLKRSSITVRVGSRVECGQVIGKIGSSGVSSSPHLHFELRRRVISKGKSKDTIINPYSPMLWVQLDGRIPQNICAGSNNNSSNTNSSSTQTTTLRGLGQSCDNTLQCRPGLFCRDGRCKIIGVPPEGSCDANQLCGPGLVCKDGKCVVQRSRVRH